MLAAAFAATVAAAVTGASLKGEGREVQVDQACAHETWPMIPPQCLTGNVNRGVRVVSVKSVEQRDFQARFAADFE